MFHNKIEKKSAKIILVIPEDDGQAPGQHRNKSDKRSGRGHFLNKDDQQAKIMLVIPGNMTDVGHGKPGLDGISQQPDSIRSTTTPTSLPKIMITAYVQFNLVTGMFFRRPAGRLQIS